MVRGSVRAVWIIHIAGIFAGCCQLDRTRRQRVPKETRPEPADREFRAQQLPSIEPGVSRPKVPILLLHEATRYIKPYVPAVLVAVGRVLVVRSDVTPVGQSVEKHVSARLC